MPTSHTASEKQRVVRVARLIALCESLPGTTHEPAGQRHIAFKVRKKTFAWYLNSHHDDGIHAVCCKSTLAVQQKMMRTHPDVIYAPKYVGKSGWVAARIDQKTVPWEIINGLFVAAYRMHAPKRLLAELDG